MKPWLSAVLACLLWQTATPAVADAVIPEAGMLLVARPSLVDPRFYQAVVLVVQHGSQGTAGLILNRPSRLGLAEALPELPELAGEAAVLCYGGPVEPRSFLVLVKAAKNPPQPAQRVLAATYLTGTRQLAAWLDAGQPQASYRVFAGYAGWAPEQLSIEVARGDWQVLPGDEHVLFAADLDGLWQELAHRPRE